MHPEKWTYTIPLRLRSLFRRRAVEQELDEEMRDHIDNQTQRNISKGIAPAEARRTAVREMGNLQRSKEECRDTRRVNFIENFLHDVRFGLRMLRKSPGFTATAVLTLALGIGANSIIFSMVDWLILRPLPIQSPEQVTFLGFSQGGAAPKTQFSYPEFRDIQSQTRDLFSDEAGFIFGGVIGNQSGPDGLTVDGKTRSVQMAFVSGNFFTFLGIKPHLGRFILPEEGNSSGADPVVVLSYRYWQARFGSDPSIVGKAASINGRAVTIVGVAPKGFVGPESIIEMQAYMPLGMTILDSPDFADMFSNPKQRRMLIFGRLKPGISIANTQTELRIVGEHLLQQYPQDGKAGTLIATPLRPPGITNGGPSNPLRRLAMLFLILGALLLILACVNVASLLLVRAAVRNREMTVRSALGASRGRLLGQMLTESVLLSVIGCIGGLIVALTGIRAIMSTPALAQSELLPVIVDFRFDWRVFAYAFGVALLTGILAGLAPALRVSKSDLSSVLREGGRALTAGRSYFRSALVAAEVAGSLTLLIVAGLFVRSLQGVRNVDLGFDPRNVLDLTIDPNEIGYTKGRTEEFYKQLLERARGIPGIVSASLASAAPLEGSLEDDISIPRYTASKDEPLPHAAFTQVTPGYPKTMAIPILRGRDLSDADNESSLRVAIINEAMAKRYWPDQDALGRQFVTLRNPKNPITVVGVMRDSRMGQLFGPIDPYFFAPLSQSYSAIRTLQIRTTSEPEAMARPIQQAIETLAPSMPVFQVQTMEATINGVNGLFIFRAGAWLTAMLGALGLVLAIVGVFGIMSYSVSQRTNEIGIRMALGAQPWQILRMIWRRGLLIVAAGITMGLFASFSLSQLASDFVVGVSPTDAVTYIGVSALLITVALVACYIPARRAMRVDPLVALRYE